MLQSCMPAGIRICIARMMLHVLHTITTFKMMKKFAKGRSTADAALSMRHDKASSYLLAVCAGHILVEWGIN